LRRNWKAVVVFLVPTLVIYVMFVWIPVGQTFYFSLFKWRGYSIQKTFVGLRNFIELVRDPLFGTALVNNLLALALVILVTFPLALLLAQILARGVRGTGVFRAIWLFPNFLGAAFVGILWLFIYDPTIGLLNGLLQILGLEARAWLGDARLALPSLTFALIWSRLGFYILLFLGSIMSIPDQIFDSAKVDGTNRWQEFFRITLPLIRQSIGVAAVFMVTWSFNYLFALVSITTEGGPAHATEIVPTFLVKQAFSYSRFGYGSAAGVVMMLLMFVLTALIIQSLMRTVTQGGEA
jgi:ABC-type sugar transport system permease subunit